MIPRGVRGPGKGHGPDRDGGGEDKPDGSSNAQPGYHDVRDQDADDVMEYARDHPGDTPVDTKREGGVKHAGGEVETIEQPASKFLRVPPLPMGMDEDDAIGNKAPVTPEMKIPSTSTSSRPPEMLDDTAEKEPRPKNPRVSSPEGSPTHLYAPHYAGGVNRVEKELHPVNEEQWEMEVEDFLNDEQDAEWTMVELDTVDEGQPPQVDEETMKEIEAAAGQEEISRLLTMGVIREPTHQEVEQGEILTTRSVDGKWKRRCRFVAREFKGNDVSSSKTFAPTSSMAAARLVLGAHVILKWRLCFLDIKDAFLLVDQLRLVLVEQPTWWKADEGTASDGQRRFWTLAKCLPGQRDAAARWFDFLSDHLRHLGFHSHMILPSLFRHESKQIGAVCHVDDLIVAGELEDLQWLLNKMKGKFVLSESGILPRGGQPADEAVRCLKKRHFFTKEGLVIMPHERYVPGLLELYNLTNRAGKATPESTQVDLEGGPEDRLQGGDQHRFRSALGTLLYISQDRIDMQHCVRNLSQFMAMPTRKAETELKHVICYLKRTENYGLLLPYTKNKSKKAGILNMADDLGDFDLLEAFTDSD